MDDFDQMSITTMSTIIRFKGKLFLDFLFPLLKIYPLDITPRELDSKKVNLKEIPNGSIISLGRKLNGKNIFRGVESKKNCFKNCITSVMVENKKLIKLKINSNNIQLCGANSPETLNQIWEDLMKNINEIEKILSLRDKKKEECEKMVVWLKEKTRSNKSYLVFRGTFNISDSSIKSSDECEEVTSLQDPLSSENLVEAKKFCIPLLIFLLEKINECKRYDYYCCFLDFFLQTKRIVEEEIHFEKILTSMINYNYWLGININRVLLNQILQEEKYTRKEEEYPLESRYDNITDDYVVITLKFDIPEKLKDDIIRKEAKRKHTFLVYQSGRVTQSGPCKELIKEAYYYFRRVIQEIAPFISKKGTNVESSNESNNSENVGEFDEFSLLEFEEEKI